MNHALLKDNVYLTLLAFYNNKPMPSFVELGKATGCTRQTASKRVQNLLVNGFIEINDENILIVKNDLALDISLLKEILIKNPIISAIELEKIFFHNIDKNNIIKNLQISDGNYYEQQKDESVVYGIISEGMIKYIGCTKRYEERIKQHIRIRPFLTINNFIILKRIYGTDKFDYERRLIDILQPEWNKM